MRRVRGEEARDRSDDLTEMMIHIEACETIAETWDLRTVPTPLRAGLKALREQIAALKQIAADQFIAEADYIPGLEVPAEPAKVTVRN